MGDEDPIRQRMAILTKEELLRVVTVEKDDWQPEALEVAQEEIRRRGLIVSTPDSLPGVPDDARRPMYKAGVPIAIILMLLLKLLLHLMR